MPSMVSPILDHKYGAQNEYHNDLVGLPRAIVPFLACGDLSGFDSDQSYPLDLKETLGPQGEAAADEPAIVLEPTQKPINPPYAQYMKRKVEHHST